MLQYGRPPVKRLGERRRRIRLDAADAEQDRKKGELLNRQIRQSVLEDAPHVFICYPPATAGWQTYVTGFNIDSLDFYRFEDVRVNK